MSLTAEEIREYCLQKPHVTEDFPFDEHTLVFRIGNKIFLLMSLERDPLTFNFKATPQRAEELREQYPAIIPGYHMNKKHWSTITLDGIVPAPLVKELIDDSFQLVLQSLPKKKQQELQ